MLPKRVSTDRRAKFFMIGKCHVWVRGREGCGKESGFVAEVESGCPQPTLIQSVLILHCVGTNPLSTLGNDGPCRHNCSRPMKVSQEAAGVLGTMCKYEDRKSRLASK